jgi:protein-S-isoprenylcysteine O-methyltransferase Ste14
MKPPIPPLALPLSAWRPMVVGLLGVVLMGGLLFGAAGTIAWAQGWTFLALWAIAVTIPPIAVARENPELMKRQARRSERPRRYERVLKGLYVTFVLALPPLAGLEVKRLEATDLPKELIYPGTLLLLMGAVALAWAMVENRHFEPTMRIQRDIGHKVIYNGPYRIVRHPGYLAAIVQAAGAPLVLASLWAWGPVLGIAAVLVARAVIEDRVLQDELKGYIAYTRQVPTILLPGIW